MTVPQPSTAPLAPQSPQLQRSKSTRHPACVALRALTAIFGGYALAAGLTATLAMWLPIVRLEAALTATMAGLIVYPCVIMWSFAARTALRALGGVLLAALPFALLLALGAQRAAA
jgi:hypothetical protein